MKILKTNINLTLLLCSKKMKKIKLISVIELALFISYQRKYICLN